MQKMAQRRGILNKLREMSDVSGISAEKFFNPQFKELMEEIRQQDDQIRSVVTGSKIGTFGNPGSDPKSLKDLLKQAKSNLNRREYLTAVADLGKFHKKVKEVIDAINSIKGKVDEVHHDFLFKDLKPGHMDELQDLRKRLAAEQLELTKQAGIMDFMVNIGTSRGRALAAWEKRYPAEVKKIREGAQIVLAKSQNLFEVILVSLKEMAQARSVRNPDDYLKAAGQIEKAFIPYESGKGGFKEFYNTTLKEWFEKLDRINAKNTPPSAKELGNKDIPVGENPSESGALSMPPAPGTPAASPGLSMPPAPGQNVVQVTPGTTGTDPTVFPAAPATPSPATMIGLGPTPQAAPPAAPGQTLMYSNHITPAPGSAPGAPITQRTTEEERAAFRAKMEAEHGITANHRQFYNSLEKLSGEDPVILAAYIAKYAKSIQQHDPEVSLQLFQIVKTIRG